MSVSAKSFITITAIDTVFDIKKWCQPLVHLHRSAYWQHVQYYLDQSLILLQADDTSYCRNLHNKLHWNAIMLPTLPLYLIPNKSLKNKHLSSKWYKQFAPNSSTKHWNVHKQIQLATVYRQLDSPDWGCCTDQWDSCSPSSAHQKKLSVQI